MADESSTALLNRALASFQSGDHGALNALIAASGRRLQQLARKMLRGFPKVRRWMDSGDVMQESVLRLCRALHEVKLIDLRHFFRLAALQMRRQLLDLARHYDGAGRFEVPNPPPRTDDSSSVTPPIDPGDSSMEPAKLARWTELHRAIETLPEEEKETFDLLWYHDLTQEDAAKLLGVNRRTIIRRWQSARLKLRAVLHDEWKF